MPYAVNLTDLISERVKADVGMSVLLSPVIDRTEVVIVDATRMDEMAVRLACSEECAEAIVQIIRKQYARYVLRIYHSKTGNGSWKRV